MTVELVVGLHVVDHESYQEYRDQIAPLLVQWEGGFGYDFQVSHVFRSRTTAPINRVFTLYFSDKAAMNSFFSDQDYLEIKQTYFNPSVTHTTIIATYER